MALPLRAARPATGHRQGLYPKNPVSLRPGFFFVRFACDLVGAASAAKGACLDLARCRGIAAEAAPTETAPTETAPTGTAPTGDGSRRNAAAASKNPSRKPGIDRGRVFSFRLH
jgi:hypothetical protein